MFLPSERLEWFLAPTMNRIQWGKIEYVRNGRNFTITDPLVQVGNPPWIPGFACRDSMTTSPVRLLTWGLRERPAAASLRARDGPRFPAAAVGEALTELGTGILFRSNRSAYSAGGIKIRCLSLEFRIQVIASKQ